MINPKEILSNLNLPNSYLGKLYDQLETLAKEAIDDSDLHTGRQLLSLIINIQELKKEGLQEDMPPAEVLPPEPKKSPTRPRYANVGYNQATKEMRDAIINLVAKKLLNLNVDISSRSLYSIIERHHLSNLEPSKLDALTLPMSTSRQDRPQWKEAISQALNLLIQEEYLVKTGRYSYTWTELAKQELPKTFDVPEGANEVQLDLDLDVEPGADSKPVEAPTTRESLPITEVSPGMPQPFAAFTKPRVYGLEPNGNGARVV